MKKIFFLSTIFAILTIVKTILETCDIWDTDYNWELEFMTIIVTWPLRVTVDSICNSCNVLFSHIQRVSKQLHLLIYALLSSKCHEMRFFKNKKLNLACVLVCLTPIFIGPRSPGQIYVSGCLSLSTRPCWNLTDVTLTDEDTN